MIDSVDFMPQSAKLTKAFYPEKVRNVMLCNKHQAEMRKVKGAIFFLTLTPDPFGV